MNAPISSTLTASPMPIRLTCYYRRQGEPQFRMVPVEIPLAPGSLLADDVLVVIAGAKTALPDAVDGLHDLGNSLDTWLTPAPADYWAINSDDGAPSGEGD